MPSVSYSDSTRTFSVYSVDKSIVGEKTFEYTGVLNGNPLTSLKLQFNIVIISPCNLPSDVILTVQPQPNAEIVYNFREEAAKFTLFKPLL